MKWKSLRSIVLWMEDGLVLSARVKAGSGVRSIRGAHLMLIVNSVTLRTHCTNPPNGVVSVVLEGAFRHFLFRIKMSTCCCLFLIMSLLLCLLPRKKNVQLSFAYGTFFTHHKILFWCKILKDITFFSLFLY